MSWTESDGMTLVWLFVMAAVLQGDQCSDQQAHFTSPVPVYRELCRTPLSLSALQLSLTHQVLNQSDCNQARMPKGQRRPICGIGKAVKGSFGGITITNCCCTMCSYSTFCLNTLAPTGMASLKPVVLKS